MSCMKDSNHRFFTSWWLVHNWFIDWDNSFEAIVYYFLIEWMICLGHWDKFHIISALVYMIIDWSGSIVSYDIGY